MKKRARGIVVIILIMVLLFLIFSTVETLNKTDNHQANEESLTNTNSDSNTSLSNPNTSNQNSSIKNQEASLSKPEESATITVPAKTKTYIVAPEITGITGHFNTESVLQLKDLRGKVVLIDFWTYSCINCQRSLPHIISWHDKYKDKGLIVIGIHTPEFSFEKDPANVAKAIEEYKIKYPVLQDNDKKTWRAFGNRYWPRKYLIDKEGYIRYDRIGEGGYDTTEEMIQKLLAEKE